MITQPGSEDDDDDDEYSDATTCDTACAGTCV